MNGGYVLTVGIKDYPVLKSYTLIDCRFSYISSEQRIRSVQQRMLSVCVSQKVKTKEAAPRTIDA